MTVKLDCPKVIANALFEVQSKIGTLGYDSANSHQKYKYVSIDKYYEKMRPILSEAGIMIIPDETHSELSADRKVFKATYQFTILHKDGAVWDYPIRRTVALQFMGAQSCGSALSYAEKIAMRTIFKINSGEKDDADILPQGDLSGLTPEQIQEINSLVSKAKLDEQDLDALHKWLKVKDLSQADPDQYENLISALKRKLP
jgi:hypothetical protein|tara:strand:- start:165 stop:767 length:603 start_codon:yes stop_codon:yes gene_type:complete